MLRFDLMFFPRADSHRSARLSESTGEMPETLQPCLGGIDRSLRDVVVVVDVVVVEKEQRLQIEDERNSGLKRTMLSQRMVGGTSRSKERIRVEESSGQNRIVRRCHRKLYQLTGMKGCHLRPFIQRGSHP